MMADIPGMALTASLAWGGRGTVQGTMKAGRGEVERGRRSK